MPPKSSAQAGNVSVPTLGWIADVLMAKQVAQSQVEQAIGNITQDTRALQSGDFYVALVGDRLDGHDYVEQAAEAGAVGALVERAMPVSEAVRKHNPAFQQIVVPKGFVHGQQTGALAALHALAQQWRRQFDLPVIGVTGSNGKTTCKQIIAAMAREAGKTLATEGNLNNHIGLPLTVLKLRAAHKFAVFEMGASKQGDIAELAAIAQPTVGLVTLAAAAHTDGFGGLEGVARGKGEMFAALGHSAVAIINSDDCFASLWEGMARCLHIRFGTQGDVRLADDMDATVARGAGARELVIDTPEGVLRATFSLPGAHNVMNALAAVAAAIGAELPKAAIRKGLAAVEPAPGRLSLKRTPSGVQILDDSYNANPNSASAALTVLGDLPGTRWMVLGEMRELGDQSESSHAEIGAFAKTCEVDRLYCQGAVTRAAADAFGSGAQVIVDQQQLIERLLSDLAVWNAEVGSDGSDITILVKGSRGAQLEHVVSALQSAAPSNETDTGSAAA